MKNITKLFAALVSSIMFVSTAIAGEMTVTGQPQQHTEWVVKI